MSNENFEILKSKILEFPDLPSYINEGSVARFLDGFDPFPRENYFFLGDLEISDKVKLSEKLKNLLREKVRGPILKTSTENIKKAFSLGGLDNNTILDTFYKKSLNPLCFGQIFDLVNSKFLSCISVGSIILPIKVGDEIILISSSYIFGVVHLDYLDPNESGFISLGVVFADYIEKRH